MEIMQIQESYIGIMQIFATMLLGNIILLWMLFRGCLMPTSWSQYFCKSDSFSDVSMCCGFFIWNVCEYSATVNNGHTRLHLKQQKNFRKVATICSGATEFGQLL